LRRTSYVMSTTPRVDGSGVDHIGLPALPMPPQPSECPADASHHSPLEYRPAAPAEESSSLTTAGSRACRGCPTGWPRTPHTRSMASSGSPFADKGFQTLIGIEESQLSHHPSANQKLTHQISHSSGEGTIFRGALRKILTRVQLEPAIAQPIRDAELGVATSPPQLRL
jgi:hypothetical protein